MNDLTDERERKRKAGQLRPLHDAELALLARISKDGITRELATELLAARQRIKVLERVRDAAEDTLAVVSNGRIRPDWVCELSEKLTMMRAALDAAKETP